MKIPAGPEELTPEWLTSALRQGGKGKNATVASFKAVPLAGNMGFYGQLVRLSLQYAGDENKDKTDAPRSLIAKFSSATPEMRKRSVDSYAREVGFYKQLAHQIELSTALCYYSDIDLETGLHVLLLQDLAPAASGSRIRGASPEQAKLAIDEIAKLHATWWGRTESDELSWLNDGDVNPDPQALRQQYEQWWPLFYQQAQERLPASIKQMGERLGEKRALIRRHVFGSAPRTLIHRDYQLDNLIFATPAGGPPFAIVDWQFLSRGRGVWDIAYFLSENLQPQLRRAIEMERLQSYHQKLVDSGIQGYTFEQCLYDYRVCLLQRFSALVSTIAVMPFSEEQRQIHLDILLPRTIAALLDHNAAELVV
jgi:hypothetical protein